MWRVQGNILYDLSQFQIIYFLVNASPPKLLEVAASNLQVYRAYDKEGTG